MEFTSCSDLCSFQPLSGCLLSVQDAELVQEVGVIKRNKTQFLSSGNS